MTFNPVLLKRQRSWIEISRATGGWWLCPGPRSPGRSPAATRRLSQASSGEPRAAPAGTCPCTSEGALAALRREPASERSLTRSMADLQLQTRRASSPLAGVFVQDSISEAAVQPWDEVRPALHRGPGLPWASELWLCNFLPQLGLTFYVHVWEASQWTWLKNPERVRRRHLPLSSAGRQSSSTKPSLQPGGGGCLVLSLHSLPPPPFRQRPRVPYDKRCDHPTRSSEGRGRRTPAVVPIRCEAQPHLTPLGRRCCAGVCFLGEETEAQLGPLETKLGPSQAGAGRREGPREGHPRPRLGQSPVQSAISLPGPGLARRAGCRLQGGGVRQRSSPATAACGDRGPGTGARALGRLTPCRGSLAVGLGSSGARVQERSGTQEKGRGRPRGGFGGHPKTHQPPGVNS